MTKYAATALATVKPINPENPEWMNKELTEGMRMEPKELTQMRST